MNHYQIVKEEIDNWDQKQFLHHTPDDEYNPEYKCLYQKFL